jgi:phage/plasmid primase-like uncharacterized protein
MDATAHGNALAGSEPAKARMGQSEASRQSNYTAPPDPWRVPDDFAAAIVGAGLGAPGVIIADGKIHRFHVEGDKPGARNGWYSLHLDGVAAGIFGSWKTSEVHTWCAVSRDQLTPDQRASFRRMVENAKAERQAEDEAKHADAARRARLIWDRSKVPDPEHPYLIAKGIGAHGVRQDGSRVVIPVYLDGALSSVQTIDPHREPPKLFLKGGKTAGGSFLIDDATTRAEILIAEGFATGASLHEGTGAKAYCAFAAGNLLAVARYVRARHPSEIIIVCADHDQWTEGNPGLTAARAAADAIGARLLAPDFTGLDLTSKPTDYNDFARLAGGLPAGLLDGTTNPRPDGPPPREDGDPGPESDRRGSGNSEDSEPAAWPDPKPLPARGPLGEAVPFPLALLPKAVQDAAREVARFVVVPEAAPALVGLATLATSIGKRAKVEEVPGLTHYPAFFLAGIADVSERKTGTFKPMTGPLLDWTEAQVQVWEDAKRKANARNMAIDAALTEAKGKAKKQGIDVASRAIEDLEAERVPLPAYPRLYTTDATEQKVFQLMHDRDGCFSVLSGEGRPVIDAIMGKYSGEGRTGDAIYLAGISGDPITRDRVGGEGGTEERTIRDPCLNVCILVQPDKYLEAAQHPSLRASGALSRIWPVWLPSLVGSRFEEPGKPGLDPKKMEPYAALVRRILSHNPPVDQQGRPTAHRATLSASAAEARRLYHNAVEGLLGEGGDLFDCRDIAGKAVSQTVKLALVLHLAERPEVLDTASSMIDAATWKTAEAIGAWFLTEAVRVQCQADEDPTLETARRVLRWLATARRETVTGRQVQQWMPRPRPNAETAAAVLDLLAHPHGYLREHTPPGARKPAYQVHPCLSVANVANVAGESV